MNWISPLCSFSVLSHSLDFSLDWTCAGAYYCPILQNCMIYLRNKVERERGVNIKTCACAYYCPVLQRGIISLKSTFTFRFLTCHGDSALKCLLHISVENQLSWVINYLPWGFCPVWGVLPSSSPRTV